MQKLNNTKEKKFENYMEVLDINGSYEKNIEITLLKKEVIPVLKCLLESLRFSEEDIEISKEINNEEMESYFRKSIEILNGIIEIIKKENLFSQKLCILLNILQLDILKGTLGFMVEKMSKPGRITGSKYDILYDLNIKLYSTYNKEINIYLSKN